MIAIQIFDHKKFKKRDQGFLGVYNIPAADAIQLGATQLGENILPFVRYETNRFFVRSHYEGPDNVEQQSSRLWENLLQFLASARAAARRTNHCDNPTCHSIRPTDFESSNTESHASTCYYR
jgi:hypothetical protein